MSDSTTLVYKKKKKKFKIFPLVNAIFFIIVACLIMIPIYRVIISSIDANTSYNFVWLPSKFTWGGYTAVLTRSSLYTPFLISVVTTIIGTFVGLLVVTLGGYVLIQWEMPGRNFFAYMLLFTMIFDGGMVPKYLVMQNLHLLDTLWAVILPMSINVYNLVLMRNFFEGIPESLFEAAQIDGANRFKRLIYITLPALANTIITVFILNLAKVMNLFESVFVTMNNAVLDVAEVLQTYVYRKTFSSGTYDVSQVLQTYIYNKTFSASFSDYGYTTAVGLFKSFVGMILVLGCNYASKKVRGRGIV